MRRNKLTDPANGDISNLLDRLISGFENEGIRSFSDLVRLTDLDPSKDFIGATLAGLDLRNEDLRGFNFSHADLRYVDFRGAKLSGIQLTGATLEGAIGLPDKMLKPNLVVRNINKHPRLFEFTCFTAEKRQNEFELHLTFRFPMLELKAKKYAGAISLSEVEGKLRYSGCKKIVERSQLQSDTFTLRQPSTSRSRSIRLATFRNYSKSVEMELSFMAYGHFDFAYIENELGKKITSRKYIAEIRKKDQSWEYLASREVEEELHIGKDYAPRLGLHASLGRVVVTSS